MPSLDTAPVCSASAASGTLEEAYAHGAEEGAAADHDRIPDISIREHDAAGSEEAREPKVGMSTLGMVSPVGPANEI